MLFKEKLILDQLVLTGLVLINLSFAARTQLLEKKPAAAASASESEPDEPLLDLTSGKANKKSDLLSQLFGDTATSKPTNTTTKSSTFHSDNVRGKPQISVLEWCSVEDVSLSF